MGKNLKSRQSRGMPTIRINILAKDKVSAYTALGAGVGNSIFSIDPLIGGSAAGSALYAVLDILTG
jgi:hypothetical protein